MYCDCTNLLSVPISNCLICLMYLVLFGYCVHEEASADIVYVGDKYGRELGDTV